MNLISHSAAAPALGVLLLLGAASIGGCRRSSDNIDPVAYQKEIEQWHEYRAAGLRRSDSWLTLSGLFWLKNGDNGAGADSSNTVVFPRGKSPAFAATFRVDSGKVHILPRPHSGIELNGAPIQAMALKSDEDGLADPTMLSLGPLSFYVISRGDRFAVRVKDSTNAARLNFKGLEYFPTDLRWRVQATFEPYNPPKILKIATVVNTVEDDSCPGALKFQIDGTPCSLDATIERGTENRLFIMFSDETSGKETYGLGRQLYTAMPDSGNHVILDFNKAYNWPCVFTEFATCPIPPRQNHLPVRIEAGEKMYTGPGHEVSSAY